MMPDLKHCHRCGRRYRNDRGDWNVQMRHGIALWILCPDCQTDAEDLEAQVNLAATDYRRDAFGRTIGFPKGSQA
jgi:hypothetical protein